MDYERATAVETLEAPPGQERLFTTRLSNNSIEVASDTGAMMLRPQQAMTLRDHLLKLFPLE
jgi:hypothetical protein